MPKMRFLPERIEAVEVSAESHKAFARASRAALASRCQGAKPIGR